MSYDASGHSDRIDAMDAARERRLNKSASKSKALKKKKISGADKLAGGHHGDYEKSRKAFLKHPLGNIRNQFNREDK